MEIDLCETRLGPLGCLAGGVLAVVLSSQSVQAHTRDANGPEQRSLRGDAVTSEEATMPLIYRVVIEDNNIDMEDEEDTTSSKELSYETEELSYNLNRPPGGAPIFSKSEAVAAGEFRAIRVHKQFRTHIEHDEITPHDLHSLMDAFQSRRELNVTIELQRFLDEEDDIALGFTEQQMLTQPSPRVPVATLQCVARITHVLATPGDSYELNFQIIGGVEQEVFSEARNFVVPKPKLRIDSRRKTAR